MAASVVPALDLDKPKLQKLQRAHTLEQIEQRRAELQEQRRRVPLHFEELARLLRRVDAELLQIFKNQQTPVPRAEQQLVQYKDALLRSRAQLVKHLTQQGLYDKEAKRSTRLIDIEVQKQKYPRKT